MKAITRARIERRIVIAPSYKGMTPSAEAKKLISVHGSVARAIEVMSKQISTAKLHYDLFVDAYPYLGLWFNQKHVDMWEDVLEYLSKIKKSERGQS